MLCGWFCCGYINSNGGFMWCIYPYSLWLFHWHWVLRHWSNPEEYGQKSSHHLYSVYPIIYIMCTVYPIIYIMCTVYPIIYIMCTVYPIIYIMCTVYPIIYIMCTVYPIIHIMCAVYPVIYTMCAVYPVIYTMCTVYPIIHIMCTLYTYRMWFRVTSLSRGNRMIAPWQWSNLEGHM